MKIKVGLVQFSPKSYNIKNNIKESLSLAKKAAKKGAKLIVLPELFDSGYCVEDKDNEFAINFSEDSYTIKKLKEFCKENDVYIVASSIQKEKTKLYDSAYIVSKNGILDTYKKTHLWGDENKRFERGDSFNIFEINFGNASVKIGIGICYEIGFGEIAREFALKGAKILIYPSAFGKQRLYVWDLASRARALENGAFVLACNRSGKEVSKLNGKILSFAGHSRIINPKGEIIKEIKDKSGVCVVNLDLNEVDLQRENLPYLRDLNLTLFRG